MAASEKLQFLITANVGDAVKGFEKVGAAADKNLSKAEQRTDKLANNLIGFGTKALAVAGVATIGLAKLGKAAAEQADQVSRAGEVFGSASGQVEEFAEAASRTAGISKTAALDAASYFGTFGKQAGLTETELAGFSTQLVQTAGDLSSFTGIPVAEALQAIGSGLSGETEPLKRFGIFLNDAALKAEYFVITGEKVTGTLTGQQKVLAANSLILKQVGDAQGDFVRTSDSAVNQMKIAQAELDNLAASLGEAVLPAMSKLAGFAADAAGGIKSLNDSTGGMVGNLLVFGTAALAAVGALSSLAGMALKASANLRTADGSLNAFGKTAKGVAVGAANLGVAFAALQGIDALRGNFADLTSEMEAFRAASQGASDEALIAAFRDLQKESFKAQGIFDQMKSRFLAGFGVDDKSPFFDAFRKVARETPDLAEDIIGAYERIGGIGRGELGKLKDIFDEVTGSAEVLAGETGVAAGAIRIFGVTIEDPVAKTAEWARGMAGLVSAQGEVATQSVQTAGSFDVWQTAVAETDTAISNLITTLEGLAGGQAAVDEAMIGFQEAVHGANVELLQSIEANGESARTLDLNTEAGRANAEQLIGIKNAAFELVTALAEDNAATSELTGTMGLARQSFIATATQMGLTEQQASDLATEYGLIPENVTTAVELSGATEAERTANQLREAYLRIPNEVRTTFVTRGATSSAGFTGFGLGGEPEIRTGGPIPGPRDAPFPVIAHGGEFVLSADVVDAIKSGSKTLGLGGSYGQVRGGDGVTIGTVNVYGVQNVQQFLAELAKYKRQGGRVAI